MNSALNTAAQNHQGRLQSALAFFAHLKYLRLSITFTETVQFRQTSGSKYLWHGAA